VVFKLEFGWERELLMWCTLLLETMWAEGCRFVQIGHRDVVTGCDAGIIQDVYSLIINDAPLERKDILCAMCWLNTSQRNCKCARAVSRKSMHKIGVLIINLPTLRHVVVSFPRDEKCDACSPT
jgi:hypothetical protein